MPSSLSTPQASGPPPLSSCLLNTFLCQGGFSKHYLSLVTDFLQQLRFQRCILLFLIVCVQVSADICRGQETCMPLEPELQGMVSSLCGC